MPCGEEETLRAVRYLGNSELEVAEVRPRPPQAGQVRVDVAYTGICGTDLHVFEGHMDSRVDVPAVVGHEMSGTIAAIGEGVPDWQIGDPVTVIPLQSCHQCPACLAGHGHVCHRLVFFGIDADGAMQGSWTLPAEMLVRLPHYLGLDQAALVEPLAVAVHDVARAGVTSGDRVLVVGGGPVGLLIAFVVGTKGGEVVVSEPSPARRELVAAAGVRTVDPHTEDLARYVDDWTGGVGADIAFEVSGAAAGMASAVASLKVRGHLTLVGVHTAPREVDLFRFFWRELTLAGARLYDRSDFEQAVDFIDRQQVDVARLISRIEPMDRALDAFTALGQGEIMKVLIDCQR